MISPILKPTASLYREALKFYTRASQNTPADAVTSTDFWEKPNGYLTFNALFHDGIISERARFQEGKRLDASMYERPPKILQTVQILQELSWEYAASTKLMTRRVDRLADFQEMQTKGHTISFTSTSRKDFLKEYQNKDRIVLLYFDIPAGTPCIDTLAALGSDCLNPAEEEVLLPPFLSLSISDHHLTEQELLIRDCNGNPPAAAYDICVEKLDFLDKSTEENVKFPEEPIYETAQRIFDALQEGMNPSDIDVDAFQKWKEAFRAYVLQESPAIKEKALKEP